jgi:TPR repeat protein
MSYLRLSRNCINWCSLLSIVSLLNCEVYAQSASPFCFDSNIINCQPANTCNIKSDNRECFTCLITNPFSGGCIIQRDDPGCEAVRAAQNAVYAAEKTRCEAESYLQEAQCASAKVALCNLTKDDGEAAQLYRLAADQGNSYAQYNLGVLYHQGRGGLQKDEHEAAQLYKLAADQGNAAAQYNLGVFDAEGRGGLQKDEREAAQLYKLAADQGNAAAQYNLGVFDAEGRGGLQKDEREAAQLYKLAADQGNAAAQHKLGVFYAEGRGGLPKDERLAEWFYSAAMAQKNEQARATTRHTMAKKAAKSR